MPIPNDKPECRVLQVFSALGIGGAETWLISLLKYLDQIKEELPIRLRFDICLTAGRKADLDEEAAFLGARLFYPHYCRENLPSFIREFRGILAKGRYHAIHDHQDYTAGLHFLMGLGHLPPVRIAHIHNSTLHTQDYNSSILRRMTSFAGKHLIARLATHIMGTSLQVVTEYGFDSHHFKKVKLGAAHCGFDAARFLRDHANDHIDICHEFGFEEHSKILLFIGRLTSTSDPKLNQKNPKFAIEVAKKCISRDSDVRMIMAGSGEEMRRELQFELKDSGLLGKIALIGPRTDIPRLISGSDLLILPSLGEGLGMVSVEAQAAGLRVLASDAVPRECEAVPGMVEFKPLDTGPSAWAEEALQLLNSAHPDQAACNLAVKNSQFSIEKSANNLLNLYVREKILL